MRSKRLGERYSHFLFLSLRLRLRRIHLPHQREACRCGGTRHSESFLEPPALPGVYSYKNAPKGISLGGCCQLIFVTILGTRDKSSATTAVITISGIMYIPL